MLFQLFLAVLLFLYFVFVFVFCKVSAARGRKDFFDSQPSLRHRRISHIFQSSCEGLTRTLNYSDTLSSQ